MDQIPLLLAKSEYSADSGSADAAELVRAAARFHYAAIALADVDNLCAQVKFHEAARTCGIRAITGVELRVDSRETRPRRLVLLARNLCGYESLCRIVSKRRTSPAASVRDPLDAIDAGTRGVFFFSDDPKLLENLLVRGISAQEVRLLVTPGGSPAPSGIRTIAAVDVLLASPQDRDLHLLQLAIRRHVPFDSLQQETTRAIPDPQELHHFDSIAMTESREIVEQCDLDLTALRAIPPPILGAHAKTAQQCVEHLSHERLSIGRAQGKWIGSAYDERLAHELTVLRQTGFAATLCIAAQIAGRAREGNIPLSGRGSAAGSLAANILGITVTDPVAHGLLFERFLHRDRQVPPDLDLDVPSGERDSLMEWAIERFGRERVAQVSAHQTFGRRAAFREGLKALGVGRSRLERFFERFPDDGLEPAHAPIPVHLLESKFRPAVPLLNRLIGRFRHLSVHPGALVFAEPSIDSYSALELAPKGVLVTQYDIHSLERMGIVKIDLLGNRALGAIQEIATCADSGTPPVPHHDEATLEALRRAETIGCFQIETPPVRAVLRKLPIHRVEDLRDALAVVRPGPGSAEDKASFIRRAHGEEPPTPPHPRLAHVLRGSMGMLLYEEDVIRAISVITGWTLERADQLRRELLHLDPNSAVHLQREFLAAATEDGVLPGEAKELWQLLLRFVSYTFNKAHASEYAHLAWEMAYLKTHRPLEFACAVLNHYGGHYPLRTLAADFTRHGAYFRAPHVNHSADGCVLEDGAVRVGLGFVKHLTQVSRARILARRPFSNLRDLFERVPLGGREKEALILCGAGDGLAPLDPDAYPYPHEQVLSALQRDPRATLFEANAFCAAGAYAPTFAALVRAHHEIKYLAMHVSDHPLHVLRKEAQREGCTPIANLTAGRRETIAALVAASRRTPASAGRLMQFVTFEDETGLVEATLAPAAFLRLEDPIRNPGPYLVEGRGEEDHGQLQWFVSDVKPFFQRSRPYEDE